LLGSKPFAVLLPIDLIHLVYSPFGDNALVSIDLLAKEKLRGTRKLVFSQDNLVWLVSSSWPGVFQNEVFDSELLDHTIVREHWAGIFYSSLSRVPTTKRFCWRKDLLLICEGLENRLLEKLYWLLSKLILTAKPGMKNYRLLHLRKCLEAVLFERKMGFWLSERTRSPTLPEKAHWSFL